MLYVFAPRCRYLGENGKVKNRRCQNFRARVNFYGKTCPNARWKKTVGDKWKVWLEKELFYIHYKIIFDSLDEQSVYILNRSFLFLFILLNIFFSIRYIFVDVYNCVERITYPVAWKDLIKNYS